ncbi:MAG: formylglycine-generating enzyme family protein [Burkholderiales bacterium]
MSNWVLGMDGEGSPQRAVLSHIKLLALLCGGVFALGMVGFAAAIAAEPTPMIEIPSGLFRMGSDVGHADERPVHDINLPTFHIDRTPVTNAQFADYLNVRGPRGPRNVNYYDIDDRDARIHRHDGRWIPDPGYEQHPVVEVTWRGAREYCAWQGKRLPTEAEWEKAARGVDGRKYPWGAAPPDNSRARFGVGYNATVPVGTFPRGASPFGVLDMAGNVWQWISSVYRDYPYRSDDGRESLDSIEPRGTRGGGHDWPADGITATHRGQNLSRAPRSGHHNIGFRCAR